jgi:pSer/pThr/pTyr-binding forkhead associated (FHA) protein
MRTYRLKGEDTLNTFARFESLAEQMIEGTFGRLFGGHLQPMQVAAALARAMEEHPATSDTGEVFAPNVYWVYLNPADYEALRETQPTLPDDLARSTIDLAERAGLHMPDPPVVEILAEASIPRKQVSVAAQYVAQNTEPISQTAEIVPEAVEAVKQSLHTTSMRQSYLILDGRRHVSLVKPVVTLGRALDNDIVLDDTRVSRHHAQLRIRQGRYVLYDTGSSGGTLINNTPVTEAVLNAGDVIALAGLQIIFGEDAPTPAEPPARPDDTLPINK